jgi:hypothetical protein
MATPTRACTGARVGAEPGRPEVRAESSLSPRCISEPTGGRPSPQSCPMQLRGRPGRLEAGRGRQRPRFSDGRRTERNAHWRPPRRPKHAPRHLLRRVPPRPSSRRPSSLRVLHMLRLLGIDPRQVPASNGQHPLEARRSLDGSRGDGHRLALSRRRPREGPRGQRDGLRSSDASSLPHSRGGALSHRLSRRDTEDNLVWKDTVLVPTGQTVDLLLDVTEPGV